MLRIEDGWWIGDDGKSTLIGRICKNLQKIL